MVTVDMVKETLKQCYDPEIPINVVDLGLIYDIRIDDGQVDIDMTLTAPGCPMHVPISREIQERVGQMEGVGKVNVKVVWEPPWTPARITDEGKKRLGFAS